MENLPRSRAGAPFSLARAFPTSSLRKCLSNFRSWWDRSPSKTPPLTAVSPHDANTALAWTRPPLPSPMTPVSASSLLVSVLSRLPFPSPFPAGLPVAHWGPFFPPEEACTDFSPLEWSLTRLDWRRSLCLCSFEERKAMIPELGCGSCVEE